MDIKREFNQVMTKVNIKPLSVNQCWQGKRFKNATYKAYEATTLVLLPKAVEVPSGALRLTLTAGLSNKQADIDNVAKPFIDILQKKYGFNDCQIYQLSMIKEIVKKGQEFISFQIECIE